MSFESDVDPILRSMEAALDALALGDLDLARTHLAGFDLDYARDIRRSKLASVNGIARGTSLDVDSRSERGSVPLATKRAIFERDQYRCRLCGLRTIDLDVLKALSRLFPDELPYHPAWKQGVTSPIYWTHSTSLEHVVPIARGGADDETNFATSCYAATTRAATTCSRSSGGSCCLCPTRPGTGSASTCRPCGGL